MKRMERTALALLLLANSARAEAPTGAHETAKARALFQESLTLAQQGDLVAALRGFEAAYAERPHFSVLYNIAQTRAALGHPVEAIAAFQRYLADGGKQVSEARRSEVEALIATNRSRIGHFRFRGGSDTTRVWLDGTELSKESRSEVISVAKGEHHIVFWNESAAPESRTASLTSDETLEITIPNAAPPKPASPRLTPLVVSCDTPDIQVEISGFGTMKTPQSGPWLVPVGPLAVRFSRPGYPTLARDLLTSGDKPVKLDCEEQPLAPVPSQLAARMNLTLTPADAEVLVDGRPYAGEPLPFGAHRLRVQQDGFVPLERSISLEAGKQRFYQISLQQTAHQRERIRQAQARSHTTGLLLGGLGLAALAASAGVYAWNSGRYDDWQTKRARGTATSEDAAKIQRGDDVALGLLIAGGVLGGTGAFVYFSAP